MYPYRQAHPQARHSRSKESKQNPYPNSNRSQPQHPKSAQTLASLANQFGTNNIRINCHQRLTVIMDKINPRKLSVLFSDRKKKRKIGIFTGGGSGHTLSFCLEKYMNESQPEYILTSTQHHNYQSLQPRGKSFSSKTRTNSETSIGKYRSSCKLSDKTPSIFSNQNIEQGQEVRRLHAYASEKKISNEQMFVVEEIASESMQSDPRESLQKKDSNKNNEEKQTMLKDEIRKNLNNITHNYLQKIGTNQLHNQQNKVIHLQNDSKLALISLKKENYAQKENLNESNHQQNNEKERVSQPNQLLDEKRKQENPKFSFAQMMRKGMIQHQSIKLHKDQSFKLAGDEEIQSQKKMTHQLRNPPCEFTDLSELSSIVSCTLKQQTKKDLELESIRNQIEKISNGFPEARKSIVKDTPIVAPLPVPENQRIQIDILNEQHQQKGNEFVQISEGPLEQNRSEFFVKYNLKEKKGLQTDVIRISPLRFRKKEEVVKHFVKARIISKESDSINIP